MGKRVDFSARTVITGDPNISMEQVGIPKTIASNLTIPVAVCESNIEVLQGLVNNAPNYPSAKLLFKKEGGIWNIQLANKKPNLRIGDTIHRQLMDDDYVIFNRQPTLHKMSMMAHRVKVMDYSTFRLNPNACTSYNADFDVIINFLLIIKRGTK